MEEALGENKDFAFSYGFGNQFVGGGYESDIKFAIEDEDDLGGTWVRVWWNQTTVWRVVDSVDGNVEDVEAGDFVAIGYRRAESNGVVDGGRVC